MVLILHFFIADFINIPLTIPQQEATNLKQESIQFQIKDQHENVELKELPNSGYGIIMFGFALVLYVFLDYYS